MITSCQSWLAVHWSDQESYSPAQSKGEDRPHFFISATTSAHSAAFTMSSQNIERFEGKEIADDLLVDAAKFFSDNYGIWGPLAEKQMGKAAKQGDYLCHDKSA